MFTKSKITKSSPFADFIRNASSAEKKRVYADVLKKATEKQLEIIHKATVVK